MMQSLAQQQKAGAFLYNLIGKCTTPKQKHIARLQNPLARFWLRATGDWKKGQGDDCPLQLTVKH